MSTLKLWDLHMKYDGPVTDEFMENNKQLSKSIADEPGVLWKIWTHKTGTNHYGSTYLFKDIQHLEKYKAMHVKRLNDAGITGHVFDIMEDLSKFNGAPLTKL